MGWIIQSLWLHLGKDAQGLLHAWQKYSFIELVAFQAQHTIIYSVCTAKWIHVDIDFLQNKWRVYFAQILYL